MKNVNIIDADEFINEEISSNSYSEEFERFQNPATFGISGTTGKVLWFIILVSKNKNIEHNNYNKALAESISVAIKDETSRFGESKGTKINESIDKDSVDSFEEYIGSKFGTSMVKSEPLYNNIGASKSLVTEIIGESY